MCQNKRGKCEQHLFSGQTELKQGVSWLLTEQIVLDPGKGDGSLAAALTEAQQEGPRTLLKEQFLLALLADEAHDATAEGGYTM